MQLQKQFADDLVVLTLNVDCDSEEAIPSPTIEKISHLLADQDIACANYIASTPMEDILGELELFGLPAAMLYDRSGNPIHKFDGEVDLKNAVVPMIESNL